MYYKVSHMDRLDYKELYTAYYTMVLFLVLAIFPFILET